MLLKILLSAGFLIVSYLTYFYIYRINRITIIIFLMAFSTAFYYFYKFIPIQIFLLYWLLFIVLNFLSIYDIKFQAVSIFSIIIFLIPVILLRVLIVLPFISNLIAVISGLLFLLIPFIITKGRGLGLGDVAIFTGLSLLVMPHSVFIIGFLAAIFALCYGLIRLVVYKKKERIPFLPFMEAAFFIYIPMTQLPFFKLILLQGYF